MTGIICFILGLIVLGITIWKTTGVGLSICRTIVRLLGGVIYVDPHYTKGTRIIFDISI